MARAPVIFAIPPGSSPAKCKACGREIFWVESAAGRRMPIVATGHDLLGATGESHFADCPAAATFRKAKP